jgi:amylosucrase
MDWITEELPRVRATLLPRIGPRFVKKRRRESFVAALDPVLEDLFRQFHSLYGWRWDFSIRFVELVEVMAHAFAARPKRLLSRRDRGFDWMHDPATTWAMGYVDRLAGDLDGVTRLIPHLERLGITHLHLMPPWRTPDGPDDGGYAVADYRSVRPDLGTIDDLRALISVLGEHGIEVVLDFVANHTADTHPWAEAAKRGKTPERDYYFFFPDRAEPDRFLPHLREIFPDRGGDAFSWRSDVAGPNGGAWVWTTFYPFQWDLNYRNPAVLVAMAGELAHIANLGPGVIRLDATPFLWKEEGTSCENLDQAHRVVSLFSTVMGVIAPEVALLSEAIVHPDDVARFVRPEECELGYNPIVMSTTWEAVATRDIRLLSDALARRSQLPRGCQWIAYLRCHDDIGWGFADEDAARLGIDPAGHRRFLNDFYAGDFDGSFARGAKFQVNPRTGDARISGTLASLAGLESALESADPDEIDLALRRIIAMHVVMITAVGIPLFYLGDELAQFNDYGYRNRTETGADNRWMHRPRFPRHLLGNGELDTASGRLLAAIERLLSLRRRHRAFQSIVPSVVDSGAAEILAYLRTAGGEQVAVLVNLTDHPATATVDLGGGWVDLSRNAPIERLTKTVLGPYDWVLAGRSLPADSAD